MAKKDAGKEFEEQLASSCSKEKLFYDRIKDVYVPNNVRMLLAKHKMQLPTTKNKYDFYVFDKGFLFALELKSVNAKSISVTDEKIIKQHQIDELEKASKHENIIAGFIFNFRGTSDNSTYFVPIDKFIEYRNIVINNLSHTYKNKVNRSSLPISICEEIGLKIRCEIKKVKYHYFMSEFIEKITSMDRGVDS